MSLRDRVSARDKQKRVIVGLEIVAFLCRGLTFGVSRANHRIYSHHFVR
jgi:hypothetical protein